MKRNNLSVEAIGNGVRKPIVTLLAAATLSTAVALETPSMAGAHSHTSGDVSRESHSNSGDVTSHPTDSASESEHDDKPSDWAVFGIVLAAVYAAAGLAVAIPQAIDNAGDRYHRP